MDLDKERLVKLLNLTASTHDGEALAAIRKSNELLQQYKSSWSEVVGFVEAVEEPVVEPPRPAPAPRPPVRAASATPPPPPPPPRARPREPLLPPGYAFARQYRNEFRKEPFLPRLLAFPYWIVLELLAALRPRKIVHTRGAGMVLTFVFSLLLGSFSWVAFGYYVVVGF